MQIDSASAYARVMEYVGGIIEQEKLSANKASQGLAKDMDGDGEGAQDEGGDEEGEILADNANTTFVGEAWLNAGDGDGDVSDDGPEVC